MGKQNDTADTPTLDDWFLHLKQLHQQRVDLSLDRLNPIVDRLQLKFFFAL